MLNKPKTASIFDLIATLFGFPPGKKDNVFKYRPKIDQSLIFTPEIANDRVAVREERKLS